MTHLETIVIVDDGRAVVRPSGEVDVASAPALRDAMLSAVGSPDVSGLTLDLGGVSFMDSSGLAAIIVAERALRTSGQSFVVANAQPPVLRVFEVTALAERLMAPVGRQPHTAS